MNIKSDPFIINNLRVFGKIHDFKDQEQTFVDCRNNYYLLLRSDCESLDVLHENAQQIRKIIRSFTNKENPISKRALGNEAQLLRDCAYSANNRSAPSQPYTAAKSESSRLIPLIKPQNPEAETGYSFQSEFPRKPKRNISQGTHI